MLLRSGLLASLACFVLSRTYCTPKIANCWPTSADVSALTDQLKQSTPRNLVWLGPNTPLVSAVPIDSPGNQPLYGQNKNMSGVYIQTADDQKGTCFVDDFATPFCMQAVRNNPLSSDPAFVLWPTTVDHVKAAVAFAAKHNLCLAVAGTGHDFLNRHSCSDTPGVLLRMSLFKNVTVNLNDTRHASGTIMLGAGMVFSEAHYHASLNKRYVASGWVGSVGVVGWSIGGGHGPYSGAAGLGVDNIVEAQLVLANGTVVVANARSNSDLWWAIRGGGGSTWGIVTALTIRLHQLPSGGFTRLALNGTTDYCNATTKLPALVTSYLTWTTKLNATWSGMFHIYPQKSKDGSGCGGSLTFFTQYITHGDSRVDANISQTAATLRDALTAAGFAAFTTGGKLAWSTTNFATPWALEPISPVAGEEYEAIIPFKYAPSGLQTVLVNQTTVTSKAFLDVAVDKLLRCPTKGQCISQEYYQDITWAADSPRSTDVSIAPAHRTAYMHFMSAGWTTAEFAPELALGEASYFSESDLNAPNLAHRYWGANYPRLLAIKTSVDPIGRFGCPLCVGSDMAKPPTSAAPVAGLTLPLALGLLGLLEQLLA